VLTGSLPDLSSGKIILLNIGDGYFRNRNAYLTARDYLIREKIDKIIFNTASGVQVRNFLLSSLPSYIELIGVVHDTEKLLSSFTQKLITRRVRKYFVLNDYIVNSVNRKSSFRAESFYPVFFPEFEQTSIEKGDSEFWVCIPGWVEFIRRDYTSLLDNLESHKINSNIKFILLGHGGHPNNNLTQIRNKISKLNLSNRFITFDDFVSNDVFHGYLEKSDIILPLIHPAKDRFRQFKSLKISGSFNLAFAHKKPLVCEKTFEVNEDFRENAFFYSDNDMINVINRLAEDREQLKSKVLYKNPKWDFEFQRKKYVNFIEE
jgi:hypothetical protein